MARLLSNAILKGISRASQSPRIVRTQLIIMWSIVELDTFLFIFKAVQNPSIYPGPSRGFKI